MSKKKGSSGIRFVVVSAMKDYIKDKNLRSEGGLEDALSAKIEEILDAAATRCTENGRSTVRGSDL